MGAGRILARSLWGLGALGVGALAWGTLVERTRFQVRQEAVPILDPEAQPIRVLHLSDLHLAPWQKGTVSWIQSLAELKPDVVVGTGDFFGHAAALPALRDALRPFAGIPGVVVHGSNDFTGPRLVNPFSYLFRPSTDRELGAPLDVEGLLRLYEDLGWVDIDSSSVTMEVNGSLLEWIGVPDAHTGRDDIDSLPARVEEAREADLGAASRPHSTVITMGVTHAPYRRVLDALVTQGSQLIFAGHTHGGQVQLPGFGALTTNCDLPPRYARGLHVWHHAARSSFLNVSAGIGTNIYAPIRFACPPEAILVTLVGDDIGYA